MLTATWHWTVQAPAVARSSSWNTRTGDNYGCNSNCGHGGQIWHNWGRSWNMTGLRTFWRGDNSNCDIVPVLCPLLVTHLVASVSEADYDLGLTCWTNSRCLTPPSCCLRLWNLSMICSFWRKQIWFNPETDSNLSRHQTMKCHLMSTSAVAFKTMAAVKKVTACMPAVCKSNHGWWVRAAAPSQKTTMCHRKLARCLFVRGGETRHICTE